MTDKTLLIALNAKYSHTSLAVRSIVSFVKSKGDFDISFDEYTINDEYLYILEKILEKEPRTIGFSVYIWNVKIIKRLVEDIKSINKDIVVFGGGPEVSYNYNIFNEIPFDFVIRGEGEYPVYKYLLGETETSGICYKDSEQTFGKLLSLDDVPFCYGKTELDQLTNRAVYYETSRGCPFKCAFCISSLTKGVRVLNLDRVFKEIDIFIKHKIKRVKLVDRTFNFDKERAKKIIKYIIKNSKDTCFHFEIGADLLDDELLELLLSAERDVIQLEAGIQSVNAEVLSLCDRKTNMEILAKNLNKLKEAKIRVHVDLIAGLPKEDFASFRNSFNEAYKLSPSVLQVGFLKLLHGSKLRIEDKKYNYKYQSVAPYEVLSNNFISFNELCKIKRVDHSMEIYHNSEIFVNSVKYIFTYDIEPFTFFYDLGVATWGKNLSLKDKGYYLSEIAKNYNVDENLLKEYIKLDFVINKRGSIPDYLCNYKTKDFQKKCTEFLKDKDSVLKIFPELSNTNPNEFAKILDFEIFNFGGLKTYAFNRLSNCYKEISLD